MRTVKKHWFNQKEIMMLTRIICADQ